MRWIALVGSLCLFASAARALTPQERDLILTSLRPSEVATVQAGTGGLESLPLLAAEVRLDANSHRVGGHARLDWPNTTGRAVTQLPVRFSSNGSGKKPPKAGWTHVKVTMPDGTTTNATVKRLSTTITQITLPSPLAPGARVVVDGDLEGRLAVLSDGATDPMMSSLAVMFGGGGQQKADGEQYGTFACGDEICTLTGFTPEVPAFIDGRFDTEEGSGIGDSTYSEPQNVIVSVIADKDLLLAVTGQEVGRVPEGKTQQRTTFAMAASREVGIIASREFVVDEDTIDGIRVRSFSRRSDQEAGKRALQSALSAVHLLSLALGQYPWTFLNVAESALVGGAGGVELPALALGASGFYRPDGGILAMLGPASDLFGDMLDFITRHEVAHQWWHAQVGSHSQLHPYIDEPLAQWSALYTVEQAEGPEAAKKVRDMQIAANFQTLGLLGIEDGPVARPAGKFDSMTEYAGLVYGKAPLFYEAASKEFGEAHVLEALRSVVTAKRFRRVTPTELRVSLRTGVGSPSLDPLWKRWFEEAHGDEDIGPLDLSGFGLPAGAPGNLADPMKALQELLNGDDDSQ